jgi:hypothetical protein
LSKKRIQGAPSNGAPKLFGAEVHQGMKRAKAGAQAKETRKKKSTASQGSRKPVDLEAVRKKITNLVGNEAVGLVKSAIDEAEKGHYAAMKYLFEMVGLYPEGGQGPEMPDDDALAQTLLRRLELPEETTPETQVTKETAEAEVKTEAVENHVE